jgi:hypothetical protein
LFFGDSGGGGGGGAVDVAAHAIVGPKVFELDHRSWQQ